MPDERAAMEQVGSYWDRLVRGGETASIEFDPTLAATIRRLHGLLITPPASARERVWQDVLANAEGMQVQGGTPMQNVMSSRDLSTTTTANVANGFPGWQRDRRRWAKTQFATAALLLLTLTVRSVVFGIGRLSRQVEAPAINPAVVGTAASPEAKVEATVAELLWQSDGGPGQPFREPNHPVIAPDGKIWVPDGSNS